MRLHIILKNEVPPNTKTQNVDNSTHPRSEVLGGNLCIQTSRTPTYIAGARTFIHVYILSAAKLQEHYYRINSKRYYFYSQKLDFIAR